MATLEITPELGELERSVAELWQRARQQMPEENLTRALTLNLIAVTDRQHEDTLHQAVERMLVRHPCRLFMIVLDEGHDAVTAHLRAEIQERHRCVQMVLEQLVLTTSSKDLPRIPGLVRPLLVNDIPVQLFWAMPLPQDLSHVMALHELADRMIIDSTLFGDGDWHRLQALRAPPPLDLAWLRLKPWRRALAQAFEHFEWQPGTPCQVTITHGSEQGARATAQKLASWLSERLGAEISCDTISPGDCPTCEPAAVAVQVGANHVLVRHLLEQARLQVTVTTHDRCLLPFHALASRGNRGDLLAAAVDA